jgi:hypothetical protein
MRVTGLQARGMPGRNMDGTDWLNVQNNAVANTGSSAKVH